MNFREHCVFAGAGIVRLLIVRMVRHKVLHDTRSLRICSGEAVRLRMCIGTLCT